MTTRAIDWAVEQISYEHPSSAGPGSVYEGGVEHIVAALKLRLEVLADDPRRFKGVSSVLSIWRFGDQSILPLGASGIAGGCR